MEPAKGPPLPKFLGILWPWYKEEEPPLPPIIYTCPTCGAQFATEAELLAHIEAEHPGEPPVVYYTCAICGATFTTEEELAAHIAAEHPEEIPLKDLILSNLVASPKVVTVGEYVKISVKVANPNDIPVDYLVKLTGATTAEQLVTIRPHETRTVTFSEIVIWEGYQTVYCDGLSVLIKGERPYPPGEPIPPGAYHCPYNDGFSGDSSCEVGTHIAEVHFGYSYPAGTLNENSFCGLGGKLALYDKIDPWPEGLEKAHWAIQNVISGEYLYKNLNAGQRNFLREWMYWEMGMTYEETGDLIKSYGTAYWQAYIRIDEIAPGWLEDGEAPEPLTRCAYNWPVDETIKGPLPEGYHIVGEPHLGPGGIWYWAVWYWC